MKGACEYDDEYGLISPSIYDSKQAIADAKELKNKVDVVIIFMHWGNEYNIIEGHLITYKDVCDDLHLFVDVIIGSHAHVTQPHFYYKNTLIAPQMGNLLFAMHITSFFLFDKPELTTDVADYEDWWFKMTKRFKNRTAFGRFYKLVFNKDGLIKTESRYMETVLEVDNKHCLVIRPVDDTWRQICSDDDVNCGGTTDCNQWECKVDENKEIKYDNNLLNSFEEPDNERRHYAPERSEMKPTQMPTRTQPITKL